MGSKEICACTDPYEQGVCRKFNATIRFYENLSKFWDPANPDVDMRPLNDHISSILVGSEASGKVCGDPGGGNDCAYLQSGADYYNLSFNKEWGRGWSGKNLNDGFSMLRVDSGFDHCMSPGPGEVALFEDVNFNRNAGSELRDCVVLKVGKYPTFNANPNPLSGSTGGSYGLNTNVISSVIVGPNTTLELYDGGSFSGTRTEIQNLRSEAMPIDELGKRDFNEKTSSIWVR